MEPCLHCSCLGCTFETLSNLPPVPLCSQSFPWVWNLFNICRVALRSPTLWLRPHHQWAAPSFLNVNCLPRAFSFRPFVNDVLLAPLKAAVSFVASLTFQIPHSYIHHTNLARRKKQPISVLCPYDFFFHLFIFFFFRVLYVLLVLERTGLQSGQCSLSGSMFFFFLSPVPPCLVLCIMQHVFSWLGSLHRAVCCRQLLWACHLLHNVWNAMTGDQRATYVKMRCNPLLGGSVRQVQPLILLRM